MNSKTFDVGDFPNHLSELRAQLVGSVRRIFNFPSQFSDIAKQALDFHGAPLFSDVDHRPRFIEDPQGLSGVRRVIDDRLRYSLKGKQPRLLVSGL